MPDTGNYVFRLKYKSKRDYSDIFEVIELGDTVVPNRRYEIQFVDSDGTTDITEDVNTFYSVPVAVPVNVTRKDMAQTTIVHRIQNTVPEGHTLQMTRLCDSPALGQSYQSLWCVYTSTEWNPVILGEFYMFKLTTTTKEDLAPQDLPGSDTPVENYGYNFMHRKKAKTTRIY